MLNNHEKHTEGEREGGTQPPSHLEANLSMEPMILIPSSDLGLWYQNYSYQNETITEKEGWPQEGNK